MAMSLRWASFGAPWFVDLGRWHGWCPRTWRFLALLLDLGAAIPFDTHCCGGEVGALLPPSVHLLYFVFSSLHPVIFSALSTSPRLLFLTNIISSCCAPPLRRMNATIHLQSLQVAWCLWQSAIANFG
ncbi:hypothetical protein BKA80DRAFT_43355 [Phyllosticta citrichinensis]